MNHPDVKTRYAKGPLATDARYERQRLVQPAIGDTTGAKERQSAKDGSRRLLIALCQYHAKHSRWEDERQYWVRRGREASFAQ